MTGLFEQKRQWDEEDIKVAMLAEGVKDPKIWRAYYVHYSSVGWLDGCNRHIFNLQMHIHKLKNNGFLALLRKNEVPKDVDPKVKPRTGEAKRMIDIISLEDRQKLARKAGIK